MLPVMSGNAGSTQHVQRTEAPAACSFMAVVTVSTSTDSKTPASASSLFKNIPAKLHGYARNRNACIEAHPGSHSLPLHSSEPAMSVRAS